MLNIQLFLSQKRFFPVVEHFCGCLSFQESCASFVPWLPMFSVLNIYKCEHCQTTIIWVQTKLESSSAAAVLWAELRSVGFVEGRQGGAVKKGRHSFSYWRSSKSVLLPEHFPTGERILQAVEQPRTSSFHFIRLPQWTHTWQSWHRVFPACVLLSHCLWNRLWQVRNVYSQLITVKW